MKKIIVLMLLTLFTTNAQAFSLDSLKEKASALVGDNVNRSNSKRPWCQSLKTNTICEKTFYDMYCISSDYDRPDMSIVKEIPVEGQIGACILAKEEKQNDGVYTSTYKVEMLCEIMRDVSKNTYSCNWSGQTKTLLKKEKTNKSIGTEKMI